MCITYDMFQRDTDKTNRRTWVKMMSHETQGKIQDMTDHSSIKADFISPQRRPECGQILKSYQQLSRSM